jgi:hypothetical protein
MKNRVAFILIGLPFLVFTAQAQPVDYTKQWGPALKHDKQADRFLSTIGFDDAGVYLAKYNSDTDMISVELVSPDLQLTSSGPLPMKDGNGKARWYEFSVYINGQIYLFSSWADKATRTRTLYAQLYNKQTRKLEPEISVASIDFREGTRSNAGSFSYRLSIDEKRILIFAKLPESLTEPERFELIVADETMKLQWNKQVALPFKDQLFLWESMRISNEGDVYLLGVAYTDMRKNKRGGKPNYSYELFRYSANAANETHKTLSLNNQFITDLQLGILPNNNVVCAGFYSALGSFATQGTYFVTLDARSNNILKSEQRAFTLDMISDGLTDKQTERVANRVAKDKAVALPSYKIGWLLLHDDGDVAMVCEDYNVVEVTRDKVILAEHRAGQIFVVRFSAQGDIRWTKKINKYQSTTSNATYLSYGFGRVGNDLVF